jgi:hypothetical protein
MKTYEIFTIEENGEINTIDVITASGAERAKAEVQATVLGRSLRDLDRSDFSAEQLDKEYREYCESLDLNPYLNVELYHEK